MVKHGCDEDVDCGWANVEQMRVCVYVKSAMCNALNLWLAYKIKRVLADKADIVLKLFCGFTFRPANNGETN